MQRILGASALLLLIVLSVRSQFWMRQPIRHVYHCAQLGLVQPKRWTIYCDPRIVTFAYDAQSVDALVAFLQQNAPGFLNAAHVRAFLPGAHVSVLAEGTIQGALLSRPVHFTLGALDQPAEVYEFWVGEAQQALLCTHEFHRPATPALFFRETPLPLLVPLVKYPVYWIETSRYRNYKQRVTKITGANVDVLHRRLDAAKFACRVVPPLHALLHLLESRVLSIYCTSKSTFIFKNTMNVEHTKSVLDLVGVIGAAPQAYAALASLLYTVRSTYGWVCLHGVSDFACVHRKSPTKTTMRYLYVYNYYAPRMKPEECLII